jgi:hypothetical protein
MSANDKRGMTARQAKRLEFTIIGASLLALVFIFQPFSQILFSIGCIGVVVGGLAFNLVPFCVPGTSYRKIAKVSLTVAIIFVVVVILALASAWLYGVYLGA